MRRGHGGPVLRADVPKASHRLHEGPPTAPSPSRVRVAQPTRRSLRLRTERPRRHRHPAASIPRATEQSPGMDRRRSWEYRPGTCPRTHSSWKATRSRLHFLKSDRQSRCCLRDRQHRLLSYWTRRRRSCPQAPIRLQPPLGCRSQRGKLPAEHTDAPDVGDYRFSPRCRTYQGSGWFTPFASSGLGCPSGRRRWIRCARRRG